MMDDVPSALGLSGDHGWADAEDARFGVIGLVVLVLTTGLSWTLTWMVAGLAPLPLIASHMARPQTGASPGPLLRPYLWRKRES